MSAATIDALLEGYRARRFTVRSVLEGVLDRIAAAPSRHVWISHLSHEQVMSYVARVEAASVDALPLYGVPFAIKDNIDLAGVVTTAGCPAFGRVATRSAFVVEKLIAAGAIPVGKTNLDQFATGLVGTRSPYGACANSFDPEYISGGSSSGSAVAVASGFVSFALGTDTAGSGRVPAAFNNIVGLKPSCGLLSTAGVVPACRSLDCVSIFALTAMDAQRVLEVAEGFDPLDAYSRAVDQRGLPPTIRIGVPRTDQREFFGDAEYARLFDLACGRAAAMGAIVVEIDFALLFETAQLLYEGPWVAERYAAIEHFIEQHADEIHPVTRAIIGAGGASTAGDVFRAQYRLKALQQRTGALWSQVDALMVPSAGTIYRIAEVLADPVKLNSNLGRYTNFVNLLDLAAVAVPAGFRADGLPFGVTMIAPRGCDRALLRIAARMHHAAGCGCGVSREAAPASSPAEALAPGYVAIAVCGAHMSGLPLNHQLAEREAYRLRVTRTAPRYRFYALPGGPPQRPGLIRVANGGSAIEVEVWAVPERHLGTFVAGIPAPLGIGKLELADGTWCSGFICESWAIEGAQEITALGGWRAFLREQVRGHN